MNDQSSNLLNRSLVLMGAKIYASHGKSPIRDGIVVITDDKITAVGGRMNVKVPDTARVIDCAGLTITAGFWNSHVHFFERKWANAASIPASELSRQLRDTFGQYGFTSVFDLSSNLENTRQIRDRIESGEIDGPRIRSAGEGLVPPGAMPLDQILGIMGVTKTALPEVANVEQATAVSKKLLNQGVDAIKLFASSPTGTSLSEEIIQAAVNEAHLVGKPVFAHPNNSKDLLAALRCGVDVIAHTTPRSGPWDETIQAEIEKRRVAITPTLWLWKYYSRHDRISMQEQIARTAIDQLGVWIKSGGDVLFGTDLGAVDPDPSGEYALMNEAGMDFRQILASLTTAPADRFGETNSGRIVVGQQADIVVLRGDPQLNIAAVTSVEYTLRAGKIIYSASK